MIGMDWIEYELNRVNKKDVLPKWRLQAMIKIKLFSLLTFLFVLYSCSQRNIIIDYDPGTSFANLKTYNWVPGTPIKTGNIKLDSNSLKHSRIKTGIDNWLKAHGYEKQQQSQADFLVTYYVTVEKKTEVLVINDYYGYPGNWGYGYGYRGYYGGGYVRQYVNEYNYGTLIIDIVDTNTKKLMWRGTIAGHVYESERPEKKIARIAKAIDRILKNFPPS